jgi:hypothetical protein
MMDINHLLQLADSYANSCEQSLIKVAKIRKLPGGKYRVLSEKGKNLGTFNSKEKAKKRLRQVEFFKHEDEGNAEDSDKESFIDLTKASDFSFSAIMREMRKEADKEQLRLFLNIFKKEFDKGVKNKLNKPEKVALQNTVIKFNRKHKIKLNKKLIKNAAVSELGDAALVGKYLADIVRFTINRIPADRRQKAIDSLKKKFYTFNADEISQKDLPPTSSIGQSITFVKHVLFNHDSHYIREVLNNLVHYL